MEWIGRYLRGAGNNPFNVPSSNCPGANTTFYGIIMDPNGDGVNAVFRPKNNSPVRSIQRGRSPCT